VRELEEIILTFPDGRYVAPGELQEWLDAVLAEDTFSEEEKDLARGIVMRIRSLSN
jgi:putative NADPH-quinone reductase